ncbi:transcription intermediary factor 1-beta [Neopsephotus bourkii]|uniref:transcription intermediary factor 1-beta n=1 Tax=Neopsephotus bourkii TaxID=309878 RepID=UPI002AA50AF0|nr:transcription intermediary factor 1-beta [Neopsephotus bourkii]
MSAPVAESGAGAGPGPGPGSAPGSAELLERCGGCGERLRAEREPRLLPCLHSLCRGCLRPAPGGSDLECPICHSQCRPQDVLENYFLWESSAEAPPGGQGASQCCTSCEDNAAATSYCVQCSEPLCGTCVEAHQRVKYTKDHTVRAIGTRPGPAPERTLLCPVHKQEPLVLFCDTCEALTCRDCQLSTHQDHRYQFLEEAVRSQRTLLLGMLKRLGDKQAALQRAARDVRAFMRRVAEVQKRVQVEVKVAILQVMKELNKRGRVLVSDAQRVTEGQQERLERQHWAMTQLQQQQEHVLRFTSWALQRDNSAALLLCRRLICPQLQGALKAMVEPVEPQGEMRFQWDPSAWTRSAESFGSIVSERTPPPSSPNPHGASQGAPQAVVGSKGQPSPMGQSNSGPPPTRSGAEDGLGAPPPLQGPLGGQGLGCPSLSPPHLYPEMGESGGDTEMAANGPPEAAGTGRKRTCPVPPPLLPKVPRVRLERLELGLEPGGAVPVPVFRVLPGASPREFSLIVIERGQPRRPPAAIKEEQPEDTKPLPSHPNGAVGPVPSSPSAPGSSPSSILGSVSCCRVCRRAGAVVMCDRCQRCFHLACHLPALHEVPSPEWRCLLCQDLPPPSQDLTEGAPQKLCPLDQQKCELVLLQLLCHEPCRPLHRLSSSTDTPDPIDLTLIRARLQEKLSPHYRSTEEFACDIWRLLRQFSSQSEDKEHVQSILALQSFIESRLNAAFGEGKFSAARFLMEPLVPVDEAPGTPAPPRPGAVGP